MDVAVDRFIFKNNQITLFPCFSVYLKRVSATLNGSSILLWQVVKLNVE